MEKKHCYGLVIVVVIIVILAGLFLSIKEPDVTVTEIRFKSLSIPNTSISFYVTMDVDNENFIGGTLKEVDANIYINGDFIGTAYSEDEFEISSNAVSEVEVVLTITNVPLSVLNDASAEVQVSGTAYVKVFFSTFEVPIEKSQSIGLG